VVFHFPRIISIGKKSNQQSLGIRNVQILTEESNNVKQNHLDLTKKDYQNSLPNRGSWPARP